jgi:hypothetical protein
MPSNRIEANRDFTIQLFGSFGQQVPASDLPSPGSLVNELRRRLAGASHHTVVAPPSVFRLLALASIEMWQRAVHSFLISASLTEASPIWSSVVGYYSSHYTVRALAHLLGYFQLFRDKKIVQLYIENGQRVLTTQSKGGSEREHRYYWRIVKQSTDFQNDPFFVSNDESRPASDSAHRTYANYADLVNSFPIFSDLGPEKLKQRIKKLSEIEISAIPIPDRERFPDVEAVQLIAYHRLVRFRGYLDTVLGGGNRIWKVHRNPSWARNWLDYQVTEPSILAAVTTTI